MKQLKLPMETVDCRYFKNCDAPMCPRDINHGRCLWFPSEPVCRLKTVPDWVLKQRKIAKLKMIDINKCFTLRMLDAIDEVTINVEGIDPAHHGTEKQWLSRQLKRNAGSETDKSVSDTDSEISLEIDVGTYSMFF